MAGFLPLLDVYGISRGDVYLELLYVCCSQDEAERKAACARGGSVSVRASHLSRFAWHFVFLDGFLVRLEFRSYVSPSFDYSLIYCPVFYL